MQGKIHLRKPFNNASAVIAILASTVILCANFSFCLEAISPKIKNISSEHIQKQRLKERSQSNSTDIEKSLAQPQLISKSDITAFVDGMVDIQLKRDDAAGAAVLVWQNGQVLLEHGYGEANIATHHSINPESTIFRGGSLSDLFTTVAVLQLVEEGKLSLDCDVNDYLDFPITPKFSRPITLLDLLSQTSGFEAMSVSTKYIQRMNSQSLRSYLTRRIPARIYPPGSIPAASEYGMAIAAYIVQRVAGVPYEEYIKRRIFLPLGMQHSSFYQPLPVSLTLDISQGYQTSTKPPLAFQILEPVSNALSTTAGDMGRFGEALLQGGQLEGQHILQAKSVNEMMSRQFGPVPMLPGMCLGLHEIWFNRHLFYGAIGDVDAFHSDFEIDPADRLVMFVAYNSNGQGRHLLKFSRGEIIHGILDRYYPYHPEMKSIPSTDNDRTELTATWISCKQNQSNRLALISLMQQYHSFFDTDGNLRIDGFLSDRNTVKKWRKIAQGVWQQYPQDKLAFLTDAKGHYEVMLLAANPDTAMIRVPWSDNARLLFPVLLGFCMIFLWGGLRAEFEIRAKGINILRCLLLSNASLWLVGIAPLILLPLLSVSMSIHLTILEILLLNFQSAVVVLACLFTLALLLYMAAKIRKMNESIVMKAILIAVCTASILSCLFSYKWHLFIPFTM